MKFPSILKVPKYRRFNLQPRYYDPIKEDIENRTEIIKKEMELNDRDDNSSDNSGFHSRISGSFSRNAQYGESKSTRIRFVLVVVLSTAAIGYLLWGEIILYVLGGIALGVFLMRRSGKFNIKL